MLRRVKNRAFGGNLLEIPSAWDAYQGYSEIKRRAHDAERQAVGDKNAPENPAEIARFVGTGLKMRYNARKKTSITPKLDAMGEDLKVYGRPPGQKLLTGPSQGPSATPAPPPRTGPTMPDQRALPAPRDVYGNEMVSTAGYKTKRPKMSLGAKFGAAGKGALLAYGYGVSKMAQGFRDRMDEYGARESDAPMSEPAPKKEATTPVSSTSSVADPKSTSPKGKLKPAGKGVYKAPKPQTTEGPKGAKKDPGIKQQEDAAKKGAQQSNDSQQQAPDQGEMELRGRASEFRQRLSAITMAKSPAPAPAAAPKSSGAQTAKESATGFLRGILNIREAEVTKWPKREASVAKFLKSKANITIRQGTPVQHTFRSNDGLHQYSGRELAMRQKILAEHKRKKFDLDPNFPNMAPRDLGAHFDYLSDKGMLEDRPTLDDSYLGYFRRKVTRVGGRLGRKVRGFLEGVVGEKKSQPKQLAKESSEETAPLIESTTPFCNFAVGNVRYPGECGCPECCTLVETAGTTFGQNMRGDVEDVGNIHEDIQKKKMAIIKRLLSRRKMKKRIVREAYEDVARTVHKDWALHRSHPEPLSVTRRPNSYFQTANSLRKLDRLGMFLAKTAIVANGLAPMAQSLMWQYKDASPQFWRDARRAASKIHASVIGKRTYVRESKPGFGDEVEQAGKAYQSASPRMKEFIDSPWATVRNASHAMGMRAVNKAADLTGSTFLRRHAYPIGKGLGYGGLVGAAYAGKKLIYDPLRKKLEKSKAAKANKFRIEMENFGKRHLTF